MEQNLIQQLIDLVTKAAPELWRIGRLQVLNINVQDFIIAAIFIAVSITIFKLMKKLRDEDSVQRIWNSKKDVYEYSGKEKGCFYVSEEAVTGWKIAGWVVISILSLIVMCNVVSIIMRTINPDYYALQSLVDLVRFE